MLTDEMDSVVPLPFLLAKERFISISQEQSRG
jgi:hypothetical protein